MNWGYDNGKFSAENAENAEHRQITDPDVAIDPVLLRDQDSIAMGLEISMHGHGGRYGQPVDRLSDHQSAMRLPSALPRSRGNMQRQGMISTNPNVHQPFQQSSSLGLLEYPDPGLIDRGDLWDGMLQSNVMPDFRAATTVNEAQSEAEAPASATRSSRNRTGADAGFSSADVNASREDSGHESRRSTRLSKRVKVLLRHDHTGAEREGRIRKVSKLSLNIAEGKAPKKGSLGPDGQVRIRPDGLMEFRDVDNPMWTLAAYHHDYRRQFLREAARDGEFDHTPARGEAQDDETSYEPSQQSWGPSRSDWQNIVNSEGTKVMFEVDKPENRRPPHKPRNWVHDGFVLLDARNHAVRDWPGLNKTLSSEIESWRWEALVRLYPWLTIVDLLARMPHNRERNGKVLRLQTPQAFTNRAYRLRVANQIPATNPRNGSATYKEGILQNVAKERATTTEALSVLNSSQVDLVRQNNKGKFKDNSRYVIDSQNSPTTPPASRKRKSTGDEDNESESEQGGERPCTRKVQSLEVESLLADDADIYSDGASDYEQSRKTAEQRVDLEREDHPTDTTGSSEDLDQDCLVPLFATSEDQGLALVENEEWTSPEAVILARRQGNQQTRQINVYWYSPYAPRHVGVDGNSVPGVVHFAFRHLYQAEEQVPSDTHFTWQEDSAYGDVPPTTQSTIPAAIDSLLDEPYRHSSRGLSPQASGNPQLTASSSSRTPLPALLQIGRYQTQSDSAEEVWRNQYGPAGF